MQEAYGAIELGGTKVRCALFSAGQAEHEARLPTTGFDETMAAIEAFFAPHRARLSAMGLASFGPIELRASSSGYGCLLATPKPGWSEVPLLPRLAQHFGTNVGVDTDVNAAALAEQKLGAGQGKDPCVYVTVGTGIGVGVVVNGRPLHGLMHPELGHIPAPPACDFPGSCPFHGRCIEGVASGRALALRTGGTAEQLPESDPVWELEAGYLAHLVSTIVLAYAPERIVLGGGVMQQGSLLERVRAQVLKQLAGYVPRTELTMTGMRGYLVAPGLGDRAGLFGALLLAQEASKR